jgi:hypothetical protein
MPKFKATYAEGDAFVLNAEDLDHAMAVAKGVGGGLTGLVTIHPTDDCRKKFRVFVQEYHKMGYPRALIAESLRKPLSAVEPMVQLAALPATVNDAWDQHELTRVQIAYLYRMREETEAGLRPVEDMESVMTQWGLHRA